MREVLVSLREGIGYSLGEPIGVGRLEVLVVPVLRQDHPKERAYVLIEEVEENLRILDSGRIDSVLIEGEIEKPILVRSGTILRGLGTQSRTVRISRILLPGKGRESVEVRCVHASHPIGMGAVLELYDEIAPFSLRHTLIASGDQARVWRSIGELRASSSFGSRILSISSLDSLVSILERTKKVRRDILELARSVVPRENQVGAFVLDREGVLSLELFDHPDSWAASHEKSLGQYLSEIGEGILSISRDEISEMIIEFLEKIMECEERKIFENERSETYVISGESIVGEYVKLDGSLIYLLALRKTEKNEGRIRDYEELV